MQQEKISLFPCNLFDLKFRKELFQQVINGSGISADYKLDFAFHHAVNHFRVSSASLAINDLRLPCLASDEKPLCFSVEPRISGDINCNFEATFEFDPDYGPISYTWPVPLTFTPKGIFVYSSKTRSEAFRL